MADYTEYNHRGQQYIYPLQNPIKKGWGVKEPDVNPASKWSTAARMVNQKNEKIDFWVEEVKASFALTGNTAQSRHVREFFPHNVVQPEFTIMGRAPNSFQYNRLANFVRASHYNALHPREITRHINAPSGKTMQAQTIRLVIRNGGNGTYPYNGSRIAQNGEPAYVRQTVKGVHKPLVLEGYIKQMKAGARKENHAPQFEFQFLVTESEHSATVGLWNDTRLYGDELKPWLDWIKKDGKGIYVQVHDKHASEDTLDAKKARQEEEISEYVENVIDPLW